MCAYEISPVIGTERLILRQPRMSDAARLAELANDKGVAGMTSALPYPYGREDAEGFIGHARDTDWNTDARFAIEHRRHGFIGMLGFDRAKPGGSSPFGPEMGYWIGRPYWGQGLATEAAQAALVWAGEEWGRRAVVAGHFADNAASGAVLIKAGFLYTGQVEPRPSKARGEPVPCRMMVWLA